MIPSLMARRVATQHGDIDFGADCRRDHGADARRHRRGRARPRRAGRGSTRQYLTLIPRRRHPSCRTPATSASSPARDVSPALVSDFVHAHQSLISTGPAGRSKRCSTSRGVRRGAAVVFAHPHPQHGGTMHTKAVYQGAKALARIGCAVLRFNFRGVGRSAGTFDQRRGERRRFPGGARLHGAALSGPAAVGRRLLVGSWIALEDRRGRRPRVTALIGIAPPVATSCRAWTTRFRTRSRARSRSSSSRARPTRSARSKDMWEFYASSRSRRSSS